MQDSTTTEVRSGMPALSAGTVAGAVAVASIFTWVPCVWKPELLARAEVWIAFCGLAFMMAFQPKASFVATSSSMTTVADSVSPRIIMLVSYLAVGAALYGYWRWPPPLYGTGNLIALAAGACMVVVGAWLRYSSVTTLRHMFTTAVRIVEDHDLVTSGPYHYTRHPSYTGAILILAAPAVLWGQWLVVPVALVALAGAYWIRIRHEERMLVAHFGDKYVRYQESVSALLPYVL